MSLPTLDPSFRVLMGFWRRTKTGTGKNPKHTYKHPGTYTVTLDVADSKGSTSNLETTVTVEGLLVDFTTTNSRSGDAPYDVNFEPKVSSSATIDSYEWDFGDGTAKIISEVPPPHTYDTPGIYTVSLKVRRVTELRLLKINQILFTLSE